MALKNYTTEVPALKSIGEIQGKLVAAGATDISMRYGSDKQPVAMSFVIKTAHGTLPFRLPANIPAVEKILAGMRARPPETWHHDYEKVMDRIHAQAARVAWRILRDWVDAQLAIIETEMVQLEEVFLPYMLVKEETTLFQVMEGKGYMLTKGGSE